jgi:hypothetical protein
MRQYSADFVKIHEKIPVRRVNAGKYSAFERVRR